MTAYRPDERSVDELRDELDRFAARTPVPHADRRSDGTPATWIDALGNDALSDALIAATIGRHERLLDNLATLPGRAATHFLEQAARVPRARAVPSRVVVSAVADPELVPVVVDPATALTGPKDGSSPSVYLTTDSLNVTGATLISAGAYRIDDDADVATTWDDRESQYDPFDGPIPAPHTLYIVSDALAFVGESLTATVEFVDGVHIDELTAMDWTYTSPSGPDTVAATAVDATTLQFTMTGGCVPTLLDGAQRVFVAVSFRQDVWSPDALLVTFRDVRVSVSRTGLQPDAAFYNDGLIDTNKEFKPFGDVPRRGDSFYIRSDEALGKLLTKLDVWLTPLNDDEYVFILVAYAYIFNQATNSWLATTEEPDTPKVAWERRAAGDWFELHEASSLRTVHLDLAGNSSEPTTVGGQTGHFVRAFLKQGDFGWSDYLEDIAEFAAEAAKEGGSPDASLLTPPTPPLLQRIRLDYETSAVPADALYRRSGLLFEELDAGTAPFTPPPLETMHRPTAACYVGLDVPARSLGTTLSVYFAVDPAASCDHVDGEPEAAWQAWTGSSWTTLAVADATTGLRTSGLVRFVAPPEWAAGCPETDHDHGRWLRYRTTQPALIAAIDAIVPDAVEATYQPTGEFDPPGPGTIKGPKRRIAGVKKITNIAPARQHRFDETDAVFVARAPHLLRHRNRALQPWDYEQLVYSEFPEVDLVACLPHYGADGSIAPGQVGIVVIPSGTGATPLPSADLALRIEAALQPRAPIHATITTLCPVYEAVSIEASILLRHGVAALEANARIAAAIDDNLHPRNRTAADFGRAVYVSSLIGLLEDHPDVDRVLDFAVTGHTNAVRIDATDHARGLVVSSGTHGLAVTEQLA